MMMSGRFLEEPRFELVAKDVFRLERCYMITSSGNYVFSIIAIQVAYSYTHRTLFIINMAAVKQNIKK